MDIFVSLSIYARKMWSSSFNGLFMDSFFYHGHMIFYGDHLFSFSLQIGESNRSK